MQLLVILVLAEAARIVVVVEAEDVVAAVVVAVEIAAAVIVLVIKHLCVFRHFQTAETVSLKTFALLSTYFISSSFPLS